MVYCIIMIKSNKKEFRINIKLYSNLFSLPSKYTRRWQKPRSSMKADKTMEHSLNQNSIVHPIKFGEQKADLVNKLCKKAIQLYSRNLQFYKLNEIKLLNAIQSEMKEKNYVFQKHILNMLQTKQIIAFQKEDLQMIEHQLELLIKFFQQLYEKKRIKEILINNSKIIQEEKNIYSKTSFQQLQSLHSELHFLDSSISPDFISEYQMICAKFGTSEPNLRYHIHVQNEIETSKQQLKKFCQDMKKAKQTDIRKLQLNLKQNSHQSNIFI